MRLSWKGVLGCTGIGVGLFLLAAWPARRNYYFKAGQVRERLDVAYVAGTQEPKQALDLYLPRSAGVGFPIVVFVHGGYWSALDRRWLQPLLGTYGNVGVAFANRGVGAAILGYRQYPTVKRGDDSLDDIAQAIRFVRDSCRAWGCGEIYAMGHSAGGHLVSLLALDERILRRNGVEPDTLAGVVSIDGIFDLEASLGAFEPSQVAVLSELFGPDAAALRAHSSSTYARARHPRLLFLDSTEDAPVCRAEFHRMRTRMRAAGSPAKFLELPGLGHNEILIRMGMDEDPVTPTLLAFIHEQPRR